MTIADYTVLQDENFELENKAIKRLTFDLPGDFVQGTFRAKPILMYRVAPKTSVSYLVSVNDPQGDDHIPPDKIHELVTQNNSGALRSMHEAIRGDVFMG